jgi:cell pole-organizing protein PopZ
MAKAKSGVFELECPCCGATLKIDPDVKAVLSHKEKPQAKTIEDISAGLEKLKQHEASRDSVFQKRVEAEKASKDVLARKFDELLKQAKSDPDKAPPKKLFDFD